MDAPCPACLFDKLTPEYIARLEAEIPVSREKQAGAAEREERLAACLSCEALREGVMCAHCGCFVRFRARIAEASCPHPAGSRWRRGEDFS
jgi:hypothetical protein